MRMEGDLRSGDRSGVLVKKRSSSGCLIVRKKGDGVAAAGSSGSRKVYDLKNERKRPRLVMSDSESSEDLPLPPPASRRAVGAETLRVCNGLTVPRKHVARESDLTDWNGEENMKRSRLDVFDFDEYDGMDQIAMSRRRFAEGDTANTGKRFPGPSFGHSGSGMAYGSGSGRQTNAGNRKNLYCDVMSNLSRAEFVDDDRFDMKRNGGRTPVSLSREKYMKRLDEPIRVQGKNGVLKVHVNKKNVGGSSRGYDQWKSEERRKVSRSEDIVKMSTAVISSYAEPKRSEKASPYLRMDKTPKNLQKSIPSKMSKPADQDSEDSDTLLKHSLKNLKNSRSEDIAKRSVVVLPPQEGKKRSGKPNSLFRMEKKKVNPQKSVSAKMTESSDEEPVDHDSSLKLRPNDMETQDSARKATEENENTPRSKVLAPVKSIKRGSGTEKQKLRENIRTMLLNAGWTIDYRPRRNRDYLDAVYINPTGTAYWSIIKAYDALQKQLDDVEEKPSGDLSAFKISDETLSQLTRKTQKKIEKEMKRKQKDGFSGDITREAGRKKSSYTKQEIESMDSDSQEEKLSSFMKQGVKPSKVKTNESLSTGFRNKSSSNSNLYLHGRKSRKLGRCTLLVRSSDKALNSESDGYVIYTGKRTLLSWLIDSGVVELSQKVQYMNRRGKRVLLEGWITRDGIHCGCCSKILTVSKFEIHAGSKLRQPFQNIYLDSGVSLLQCQINAWNKQEESKRLGFYSVDTDGDDPNDDTCGICGDGGDLICCDSCPSTYHQSCLHIEMLPMGDWHCPNCTCKYCGLASGCASPDHGAITSEHLTCNLCERKFHDSCIKVMDTAVVDSTLSRDFCSPICRELFELLQKDLGVKHELEAGYSWSLLRRTDPDSDASSRGFPQTVECNSKLAIALNIMDECFLPIIDRRTGINIIHNVLYNCGSNFNRINYSGFYTVVLERGDEVISAASLRFHGTQLAEMPFIGTRHIYRRQGMCRRLFSAIQSALRSLKVEKLVIPAISELMHTWTGVFGFSTLAASLKQELRSLNMLVFPGLDMLQKLLLEEETIGSDRTAGVESTEPEKGKNIDTTSLQSDKSGDDCSAECGLSSQHNDRGSNQFQEMSDKVDGMDTDTNCQDRSSSDTSATDISSDDDTADNTVVLRSSNGHTDAEKDFMDKDTESKVDQDGHTPSANGIVGMSEEDASASPVQRNAKSVIDVGDSHEINAGLSFDRSGPHVDQSPENLMGTHEINDSDDGVQVEEKPGDGPTIGVVSLRDVVNAHGVEIAYTETVTLVDNDTVMDEKVEDVYPCPGSSKKDLMPVDSNLDCHVNDVTEVTLASDMGEENKPVSLSQSEDSIPSSMEGDSDDTDEVN